MFIHDFQALVIIPFLLWGVTRSFTVLCVTIVFVLVFLYSPELQHTNYNPNTFYSSASGHVRSITIDNTTNTISLFLNVFDNHAQYIPVKSMVVSQKHVLGVYNPAYQEHAINNEQIQYTLHSIDHNFQYTIKQITGVITRRLVSFVENNKEYSPGQRLGFILLGSRVDIVVPSHVIHTVQIQVGQHIDAMTPLFRIKDI